MERVGEHAVPAGPLAARWLAYELEPTRAGALGRARVALENAGSASWRSRGDEGIQLSYHWLDAFGNAIVWDGIRTRLPRPVAPGERLETDVEVRAPMPPGRYRLAFDLVHEYRYWLGDVGNVPLDVAVDVAPRIERRLAVSLVAGDAALTAETRAALARLEEPLVEDGAAAVALLAPGCVPAPDWSRRILDAHQEGYALVGGSIEPEGGFLARRRAVRTLALWRPGTGRNPRFPHPLLCPSTVTGVEPARVPEVDGLPAAEPPRGEPALYDGRIAVRLRLRSGRPRA